MCLTVTATYPRKQTVADASVEPAYIMNAGRFRPVPRRPPPPHGLSFSAGLVPASPSTAGLGVFPAAGCPCGFNRIKVVKVRKPSSTHFVTLIHRSQLDTPEIAFDIRGIDSA